MSHYRSFSPFPFFYCSFAWFSQSLPWLFINPLCRETNDICRTFNSFSNPHLSLSHSLSLLHQFFAPHRWTQAVLLLLPPENNPGFVRLTFLQFFSCILRLDANSRRQIRRQECKNVGYQMVKQEGKNCETRRRSFLQIGTRTERFVACFCLISVLKFTIHNSCSSISSCLYCFRCQLFTLVFTRRSMLCHFRNKYIQ